MPEMSIRTAEDFLRDEYFSLLPHIRYAMEELEAEVRHLLVPLGRAQEKHERIVIKSRMKECESAIAALRRREDINDFDRTGVAPRSLKALNDLVGVRVLAFPRCRVLEIDHVLRQRFGDWVADPVPPAPGTETPLALKYHGFCSDHCRVRGEIQVMSLLVGMFWEVEHGALYKPGERLRDIELSLKMQHRNADVVRAIYAFETEFEELVATLPQGAEQRIPHQATADFNTLCG
jgi:ppGpp synthetase/RelA/SpoT-type nucleotidyltranferase